ncbi:MAG: DNA-directed RNA polymerase subunit beta' [Actinomycetota bacterium]|nr:DNA-directed RNA polymerase subunit beta' [Actinomycetota bacterium]
MNREDKVFTERGKNLHDLSNFDALKISICSPEQIRSWSSGEVKKPETINYRTLKPEKDGLFCEKIFGPTKDWECYCGKYKKIRFKGIICERCGVEVTRAKVRRERMGHIELAAPVAHIWYFKGVPSRMGYLLDISPKDLERVLYFSSYMVTEVKSDQIKEDYSMLKDELEQEISEIEAGLQTTIKELEDEKEETLSASSSEGEDEGEAKPLTKTEIKQIETRHRDAIRGAESEAAKRIDWARYVLESLQEVKAKQLIADDRLFRDLRMKYGDYIEGGMGAETIFSLLGKMDLESEVTELREIVRNSKGQKHDRAVKRLKVMNAFLKSGNKPEWMILFTVPIIPPDLRPMVQLDGGRFATSDLNDLYRRVINRNNRLKRLLDLGAPEIIVNNEKRMLQEAVDALFDNGRRARPVTGPGNRPLKSLSDMLKGKQGRFRQNLLGKRVDYSGRSVIVIGPDLKLHQCGLPKVMALELFKPFVMRRLVERGHAQNIKSAKRMVEKAKPIVWDILEETITAHPVLLNRAPTLHQRGIQAFEPILIEGKAIQIHPLVCTAFNADFDGDQMAVHLPLSLEAQAESRILMLSAHNVLSPAHGRPLVTPTQDMVLGCFYLTASRDGCPGEGMVFSSPEEAVLAYHSGDADLQAKIKVRMDGEIKETTTGRIIFNEVLPIDYPYINYEVNKKQLTDIVADCVDKYDRAKVAEILDSLKRLGFDYSTKAGLTISVDDIEVPPNKQDLLDIPEEAVEKVERQYRRGLITNEERHQKVVDIWTKATEDVSQAMEENFDKFNPIYMMAQSGARGNLKQIRQLAGMRGLVANPKGDIIDRPIKANFREGLTVLEYFISTHGARKGLADTALRTADSGYLTRRLVDVAQEVIVREDDCGATEGIPTRVLDDDGNIYSGLIGRAALNDINNPKTGKVIVATAGAIGPKEAEKIKKADLGEVMVRTVMGCKAKFGICKTCYGWDLAQRDMVDFGTAVGIIAAQSIGEPGTQLTMRTFHTGGVAGEDITHGLPRVVELFEARKPKGQSQIAEIDGAVSVKETDKHRKITITASDGKEKAYQVSRRSRLKVSDGDQVKAGDQLTEGSLNPHDILSIKGKQAVQLFLVEQVQEVYRSQGVDIHDKHIEVIARQMLRKLQIVRPNDTDFLTSQLVDQTKFDEENARVEEAGGKGATAKQVLLGITKASLATDSFLSAASFQETTRVLTEAAIAGKVDPLLGLKENVVIGKLIPAATGMNRYRNIDIELVDPLVTERPGESEISLENKDQEVDIEA